MTDRTRPTVEERFWAKVDKTAGCWTWTGAKSDTGYGNFTPTRRHPVLAHRFAFELIKGPIPTGLDVDHECHNEATGCAGGRTCAHRLCVNPAHLYARTRADNLSRSPNTGKGTHCPSGHEFAPENTYDNGVCKTCARARTALARAKRKAA